MFEQYRPLLFSIAYRMLGTATEAEDMVQETYLRLQQVDVSGIQHPKAYLSQTITRLCLDHLKSAHVQRETYIGPWLPEPILTSGDVTIEPEKTVETWDSISFAFLVLLEKLSPNERAVFILREVFDYEYDEIASILGKDEAACRQLFSRAKKHIRENRPRYERNTEQHNALLSTFLDACATGDMDKLTSILAEESVFTSDGGGQVAAATRPILGRERIVRFIQGLLNRAPENTVTRPVTVNGQTGIVTWVDNEPVVVFLFETDQSQIRQIWAIRNPDKLRAIKKEQSK